MKLIQDKQLTKEQVQKIISEILKTAIPFVVGLFDAMSGNYLTLCVLVLTLIQIEQEK
ncbi:hypothetical protein [Phormidium nigroviride]